MEQYERNKKKIRLAAFLRGFQKELKLPTKKAPRPVVIVPAGPACVGKTTTMKFLQKKLPYFVRIARDDMRVYLYRKGFTDKEMVDNFLFRASPSFRLAKIYLKKGYSLILDYNFAAFPSQSKPTIKLAEKMGAKFFVLRIDAPAAFIKNKLRHKRFLKYGVMPNWKAAYEHFLRTSKQFDYDKFNNFYLAHISTARPLAPQMRVAIRKLYSEMFPQTTHKP
jgi:predicted kinase